MRKGSVVALLLPAGLALPALGGCDHTMELSTCRELFVEFPVDPAAVQRNLPAGYAARVREDGKGVLLLMVQDCDEGLLDGFYRVRPLRLSHLWLEVTGPDETGPALPGTPRALPTAYYYASPHQTDSLPAHLAFWLVGIDSDRVSEIALGGAPGGLRHGHVAERAPAVGYRWTDAGRRWAAPDLVTGRRHFDRQYGSILRRASRGLVECRSSFLGEAEVTLEADPGSAVGRLGLGGSLRGSGSLVEMSGCRARIEVGGR